MVDGAGPVKNGIRPRTHGIHGRGGIQLVAVHRVHGYFQMNPLVLPGIPGNGRGVTRYLIIEAENISLNGIQRGQGRSHIRNLPFLAEEFHHLLQAGQIALVHGYIGLQRGLHQSLVRKAQSVGGILKLAVRHVEIRTGNDGILRGRGHMHLQLRIRGHKAYKRVIDETDDRVQLGIIKALQCLVDLLPGFGSNGIL